MSIHGANLKWTSVCVRPPSPSSAPLFNVYFCAASPLPQLSTLTVHEAGSSMWTKPSSECHLPPLQNTGGSIQDDWPEAVTALKISLRVVRRLCSSLCHTFSTICYRIVLTASVPASLCIVSCSGLVAEYESGIFRLPETNVKSTRCRIF